MLDSDLADLYRVTTGNLNLAVRRNADRFPEDFMFQLTKEESALLLQTARANTGRGGRQTSPYAFTEHGVAMLSSVLRTQRAVQMSIFIVRAFIKLRELMATNKAVAQRLNELTAAVKEHAGLFNVVIRDMQNLDRRLSHEMALLKSPRRAKSRIGFHLPG